MRLGHPLHHLSPWDHLSALRFGGVILVFFAAASSIEAKRLGTWALVGLVAGYGLALAVFG